MKNIKTVLSSHAVFEQGIENFQSLLNKLQSESTQHLEHGKIESDIQQDGIEILRNLLQAHLDFRALDEKKAPAIRGADGEVRTHCRMQCSRSLMTLFGEVRVKRIGYSARNTTSVYPMDKELNLPNNKYSHGLCEIVMYEACQHAFDQTVHNISRQTGGKIGKRQVEELTVEIAQDFERFYAVDTPIASDKETCCNPCNSKVLTIPVDESLLLVMTTDAKGIVMHNKDLRKETKKAANRQANKLKTRLSRGEKKNRKRMATVASVYEVDRHKRSAKAIMGLDERSSKRPVIQHKRVWASVERESNVVTQELFTEAKNRMADSDRECVVLVDGDNHQLSRINAQVKALNQPVTVIVDFIHVLEYLWKAAYCFHEEGSCEAESWVQEKALALLSGNASHVAAGMKRSATLKSLSSEQRKAVDTCANYILKRKEYLRYEEYLSKGYPIATGVIEGACRHLIKDRMDITGARWRLKSAEAVLKLRSISSSHDAERYFKFYTEQSLARNYGDFIAANCEYFGHEKLAA